MEVIKAGFDANWDDTREKLTHAKNTVHIGISPDNKNTLSIMAEVSNREDDWIVINIKMDEFLTALGKSLKEFL